MAGGSIYQKTINSAYQGGTDKSLLIEPHYAYQVPFDFSDDWSDIKIGMFVSYVMTGQNNENAGVADRTISSAGGTSADTFNYVGIVREGATPTLPFDANNNGYLGLQADRLYTYDTTSANYNKLMHGLEGTDSQGRGRFISTNGISTLESKPFQPVQGNFNVISMRAADAELGDGASENETLFCDYWGLRYQVLNKGESNQMIRFTASLNGGSSSNGPSNYHAISDPSMENLKLLMNGVGEFSYSVSTANMHADATQGFKWHDPLNTSTAYPLPNSLFFYNGFSTLRPRIHAWAAKKIS